MMQGSVWSTNCEILPLHTIYEVKDHTQGTDPVMSRDCEPRIIGTTTCEDIVVVLRIVESTPVSSQGLSLRSEIGSRGVTTSDIKQKVT